MAASAFPDRIALVIAECTPQAFWRALGRAQRRAQVVELRLDALPSVAQVVRVLERLARQRSKSTLIATCRRTLEGGGFTGSPSAQLALLDLAARAGCAWVDIEGSSLEAFPARLRKALLPRAKRIISLHDFQRTPARLESIYRRLARLGADQVKLAVAVQRQRDNVALLELARRHRRRVIAIGMGAVGIPARVLALRAGSSLAYAVPDRSPAVAPGQLKWSEMHALYRAGRLSSRTRVYGVIGKPITHSLSPPMHNAALASARLDAVYLPFEVDSLRDFLSCLGPLKIAGFSVTHPHKQAILRYLDGVDPVAATIGAVNTVVVRGGSKLYGYNTDYVGVLRTLERFMRLQGSRVLLVGAGGAARAVAFALATAGAVVCVTARRTMSARRLAHDVGGQSLPQHALTRQAFDAIVNCTPVGQAPEVDASPLRPAELNCRVLFDLVYNPRETRLLRLARRRGIRTIPGWHMLVEQGAAQFEIWTGLRAPVEVMRRAVRARLSASSPKDS